MKWGYEIFGRSFEEHVELSKALLAETKSRFESGEYKTVHIEENTLEEHIEAGWGKDEEDDRLHYAEIDDWKKGTNPHEPTLILSPSGEKTYLMDTLRAAIGHSEDTFYFHSVWTCDAVIIDFETPQGELLRFAQHMDDKMNTDEGALPALIQEASALGTVKKLAIFYNSQADGSRNEQFILALKVPETIQKEIIDMTKIWDRPAHDIYIQGNEAKIYHNEGDYDLETDTASVRRVKSGDRKLFS